MLPPLSTLALVVARLAAARSPAPRSLDRLTLPPRRCVTISPTSPRLGISPSDGPARRWHVAQLFAALTLRKGIPGPEISEFRGLRWPPVPARRPPQRAKAKTSCPHVPMDPALVPGSGDKIQPGLRKMLVNLIAERLSAAAASILAGRGCVPQAGSPARRPGPAARRNGRGYIIRSYMTIAGGDRHIDAEPGRDLHHIVAALGQRRARANPAPPPAHRRPPVGCLKLGRSIASSVISTPISRQPIGSAKRPSERGHAPACSRSRSRYRTAAARCTSTAGWIAKAKLARKACAVRRMAPRFIGFEMPSTPIPK